MGSGSDARRDRASAAVLAALAVGYLVAGRGYPLDTLAAPGPGVFPLAAAVALLALALRLFVAAGRQPPSSASPSEGGGSARSPVLMAVVLVLYAAALPRLGFLVTSFALVFLAARLMGLPGWWRPLALALGVTLASRVIFVTWLGVPLP